MTSIRSSLAISFVTRYTSLILTLAGSVIIARLLTPEEIGIYAIGSVIIGFAQIMRAFGVGSYLIQEKELNEVKIRAAFMVTLCMAWVMGAITLAVAPWAGDFYREPHVSDVIMVMSINLFLIPFGSITLNLLKRDMEFGKLYWIYTVATATHFVVSVGLAWAGFGTMGLALASVANVLATIGMCLLFRPAKVPWLPGFKGIRNVLNFSFYLTGAGLSQEAYNSLPDLVIGKVLSMSAVAYFNKAMGAVGMFGQLVTSAILPVALPHFSQIRRSGEGASRTYLKALSYITVLAWPFFAFLACMAEPIILILFGPQWEASVPIARILAFYGMLKSAFSLTESLFVSHGKVDGYFKVRFIVLMVHAALILATVDHGLEAMAMGFIASGLISMVIVMVALQRTMAIGIRETIVATYKGMIVAAMTALVPLAISLGLWPLDGLLLPLTLAGMGGAIGWLAGIFLTRHALSHEFWLVFKRLKAMMRS